MGWRDFEALFERLFGFPVPRWIVGPIAAVLLLLVLVSAVEKIADIVKWVRSGEAHAWYQTATASGIFRTAVSLRFLGAVAVVIWVVWVSAALWRLNDDIVRYVVPRRLTDEQEKKVAAYLSKVKPHDVRFTVAQHNEEAGQHRADCQRAIEKGGWPVISIDYARDVPEGVGIHFSRPIVPGKTSEELARERVRPRDPEPNEALQRAFQQAGVLISRQGSGSGQSITTTTLTVTIGPRRRDYHALPRSHER